MSANSPEIDCNCDDLTEKGDCFVCCNCGRVYRLVANGQDDIELEEVEQP